MAKVCYYKKKSIVAAAKMVGQPVDFRTFNSTIYAIFPKVKGKEELTALKMALVEQLRLDPGEKLCWDNSPIFGTTLEVGEDTEVVPIPLKWGPYPDPLIEEAHRQWALRAKDLRTTKGDVSKAVACDKITFTYEDTWYSLYSPAPKSPFLSFYDLDVVENILWRAGCEDIKFESDQTKVLKLRNKV